MSTMKTDVVYTAEIGERVTACAQYGGTVYIAVESQGDPSLVVVGEDTKSLAVPLERTILQLLATDGKLLCVSGSNLEVLGLDGVHTGSLNAESPPIFSLTSLNGEAFALTFESGAFYLSRVDTNGARLTEKARLPLALGNAALYSDDDSLLVKHGSKLYRVDRDEGAITELLDFVSYGIAPDSVKLVFPLDNGTFGCYAGGSGNDVPKFYMLSQGDLKIDNRIVIKVAVFSADSTFINHVVEFNKNSEDVRVEIVTYDSSDGYYTFGRTSNNGVDRFLVDLIAGVIPDIIDVSAMPVELYAGKGMFEDLYPMMDSDSSVARSDIYPAILSVSEIDGKLYNTISKFDLLTVAASKDLHIGRLSLNDAVTASADNDRKFLLSLSREATISLFCAIYARDFVDWSNFTCDFDSEPFVRLLEIAREQYSEEDALRYENANDEWLLRFAILGLRSTLFDNLADTLGEFEFVGFPGESGSGHFIQPRGVQLAISSASKHKDAAWSFVKTLLSQDYQSGLSASTLRSNISAQSERIGAILAAQTNPAKVAQLEAYYAMLGDTLNESDALYVIDVPLYTIILEETAAYFAGDKSAEECARVIQSRASLYVGEQR
jgi:hypothetical protein